MPSQLPHANMRSAMHSTLSTVRQQTIGLSEMGRPIIVNRLGGDCQAEQTPLRILAVGGQHGDEGAAIDAVDTFAQHARRALWQGSLQNGTLQLALLPCLNPDGVSMRQRSNAKNIDLNRDHQLLRSAETQTLHHFVRTWQPHLIIDVHTYPPRRKHLLAQGLVYCHDLFADVPTNPAIARSVRSIAHEGLLEPLLHQMNACGLRSGRYTLINRPRKGKPGRVRHSTTDVMDARNGLALRYNIPTLLLEGREPRHGSAHKCGVDTVHVLQQALEQVIALAQTHPTQLIAPAGLPRPGNPISLRTRYRTAAEPCVMLFADASSGQIHSRELPGKYTPDIDVVESCTAPAAYAVPKTHGRLIDLLHRHGFAAAEAPAVGTVEAYQILNIELSKRQNRPPRKLHLHIKSVQRALDDYIIFPIQQLGGSALALWLEPASKYGLSRFAETELMAGPDTVYPVLRLISWPTS